MRADGSVSSDVHPGSSDVIPPQLLNGDDETALPRPLVSVPGSRSVKPTEKLGEAVAPDGTVLMLLRHDGAYSIRVAGVELMSTRRHLSEDRLAELVCEPLRAT